MGEQEAQTIEYEEVNGVIKCPYQILQTSKFRYCQQETCPNSIHMNKCGTKYHYCRTEELEDEVLSAISDGAKVVEENKG